MPLRELSAYVGQLAGAKAESELLLIDAIGIAFGKQGSERKARIRELNRLADPAATRPRPATLGELAAIGIDVQKN